MTARSPRSSNGIGPSSSVGRLGCQAMKTTQRTSPRKCSSASIASCRAFAATGPSTPGSIASHDASSFGCDRRASRRRTVSTDDLYVTDPGARVDGQRAVALIRTIAATLPMRQREVFMLCDIEGRTPAEVAGILDMKDVSVRASLFKARASIRRTILATHPCYREPPR